jgi:hypothetical protein
MKTLFSCILAALLFTPFAAAVTFLLNSNSYIDVIDHHCGTWPFIVLVSDSKTAHMASTGTPPARMSVQGDVLLAVTVSPTVGVDAPATRSVSLSGL